MVEEIVLVSEKRADAGLGKYRLGLWELGADTQAGTIGEVSLVLGAETISVVLGGETIELVA